jgi:hypothetical protein
MLYEKQQRTMPKRQTTFAPKCMIMQSLTLANFWLSFAKAEAYLHMPYA